MNNAHVIEYRTHVMECMYELRLYAKTHDLKNETDKELSRMRKIILAHQWATTSKDVRPNWF